MGRNPLFPGLICTPLGPFRGQLAAHPSAGQDCLQPPPPCSRAASRERNEQAADLVQSIGGDILSMVGCLLLCDPYGPRVAQHRGGPAWRPRSRSPTVPCGKGWSGAPLGVAIGRYGVRARGFMAKLPGPAPDRGWSAEAGARGTCVLPYLRIHLLIDRCFVEGIREGDDDRVDRRPVGEEVVSHRVVGVLVVCNRLRHGCLEVL